MAVKIAQTKTGTSTFASTAITWDNNTVSGNLIVVAIACNVAADVSSVTDSQGNVYTQVFTVNQGTIDLDLWYAKNILGGATPTVTVNYTSSATCSAIAREYSGLDTVIPLNKSATSSGNSSSLDSTNTTRTNQPLELLVGVAGLLTATINSAGTGFSNLSQVSNVTVNAAIEDKFVTSQGTYNATFTPSASDPWACGIATFALAPQGTTTSASSTSVSSTSISSTSISSTSSSVSTSSTSASTSSISTSSTSSSISTSSTSSSTSSTSSSISSTSMSSTSASTSISSTSSSISSTSFSSTSLSSTSSSSSISSTSSSFSSTSSSQSSTSASTSSTSLSSTSSSSSTSTTAIPINLDYSYQDSLTLPATSVEGIDIDTSKNVQNVAIDDGDYFIQYGSEYMIQEYKKKWTNNTDIPSLTFKGRMTYDTRLSPLLIQIYNVASTQWETLKTINTLPADTDSDNLTVTQSTNMSNYYDSNKIVTFRIYQQVL